MSRKKCILYSDGACSGNPGPGGWAYVLAFEEGDVFERSGFESQTTNNRMELTSALEGMLKLYSILETTESSYLIKNYDFIIYSDSVYFLKGITQWIHSWKKNGWKTSQKAEVTNQDLWIAIDDVVKKLSPLVKLDYRFVKGHAGHFGNERCDELAVKASQGQVFKKQTVAANYNFEIFELPPNVGVPEMKYNKNSDKAESSYYISLVNGVLVKHSNWTECERSVKGVSGAKFKKVKNSVEEDSVLKSWGYKN